MKLESLSRDIKDVRLIYEQIGSLTVVVTGLHPIRKAL